MAFVPMKQLMEHAIQNNYAVPSFCVWSCETMNAVLSAARECRAPVMLMAGPVEYKVIQPRVWVSMARAVMEEYDTPAALVLDHGDSVDLARRCLEYNFTSVMLDYSAYPFAENVAALKEVVTAAKRTGATVEGEIGAVGRADTITGEGAKESTLTDPAEAAELVATTGIDALAVSIGNAHGNYPALPTLDFNLLARIRERVSIPLVLHGGTGTPEGDLHRAISLGIAKVNVASALTKAVKESLQSQWADSTPWLPSAMGRAADAMKTVVKEWICRVKADDKAEGGA